MTLWRGQARSDVLDLAVYVLQTYTLRYGSYETAQAATEAFEAGPSAAFAQRRRSQQPAREDPT